MEAFHSGRDDPFAVPGSESRALPHDLNRVPAQDRVIRHQYGIFRNRHSHEQAIKRIAMVMGQAFQGHNVVEGDRKKLEAVPLLLDCDDVRQRLRKGHLSKLKFYLDLPGTRNTQK